jgi:membrane protein DedA with SNARE-associated domain
MLCAMRTSRRLLLASLAATLGLILWAVAQGDLLEEFADIRSFLFAHLSHAGEAGSLALLYLEESGLPLPVPGDVVLIYMGSQGVPFLLTLAGAVAVVAAGSSNLYFFSRRFGPRLLASPSFTSFFYLSPTRLDRAQAWFERWGMLALIFGRHVPGLRIPLTFVAGSLGLPYRRFLPSIVISASLWATLWLLLGARYASGVTAWLTAHSILYLLLALGLLAFLAISALRALRAR